MPDDIVGRYKKDEIVSALLNAEVIDDQLVSGARGLVRTQHWIFKGSG